MVAGIFITVGILFAILVGYVASLPSDSRITREIVIRAEPEKIFPHINNSQKSNAWMPWQATDPGAEMHYSGPAEGVGATTSWDSKGKMGTGKAEVIESIPLRMVKTRLTYTRPMNMSQLASVSLQPEQGGTRVRWEVTGKNSFLGRFFCLFMNMEKIVGGAFETGLANLKGTVENTTVRHDKTMVNNSARWS